MLEGNPLTSVVSNLSRSIVYQPMSYKHCRKSCEWFMWQNEGETRWPGHGINLFVGKTHSEAELVWEWLRPLENSTEPTIFLTWGVRRWRHPLLFSLVSEVQVKLQARIDTLIFPPSLFEHIPADPNDLSGLSLFLVWQVGLWTRSALESWLCFLPPWARRHWSVHLVYLVFLAVCDTLQQFPSKKVSCK